MRGLTHRRGGPAVEVVAVPLWGDGGRVHDSGGEVQGEGTAIEAQPLGEAQGRCVHKAQVVWVLAPLSSGQGFKLGEVRGPAGH